MGCITLLSDFGLQDPSVAVVKGLLIQQLPEEKIIDISHDVTPFHAAQAAYLLGCSYKNFPAGTIHLLLFDMFARSPTRLILTEFEQQYFLSTDNEVIPLAVGNQGITSWLCLELAPHESLKDLVKAAAAEIERLRSLGKSAIQRDGFTLKPQAEPAPVISPTGMFECEAIHIDRYENVVLNMTRERFEKIRKGRSFRLQFMRVEEISTISTGYHEVRAGYKLCRFNSSGYLEICINRGKAASLFGIRLGSRNNDIKLIFE